MPSPLTETRTLPELITVLGDLGLAHPRSLEGAEFLVGWESAVVRSRDGWIYRFSRLDAAAFERELKILAVVNGRLGAESPKIEAVDHDHQLMVYRTIVGAELDLPAVRKLTTEQRRPLVRSLAELLAAMHDLLPAAAAQVEIPSFDGARYVQDLQGVLPTHQDRNRQVLEDLLHDWKDCQLSAAASAPVLLHGDFHFGNVVFASPTGPVTGAWDFSCVAAGDPAADFRYLTADSVELTQEVATAYGQLTGREVDLTAATVCRELEDLSDAIAEGRPLGVEMGRMGRPWQDDVS